MAFVHLHCRSQYSILDGAVGPAELAEAAAAAGMPAVALVDTANLYGAYEFAKAAKDKGIGAVLGATLSVWPDGLARLRPDAGDGGYAVLLLIEGVGGKPADQSVPGYRNLSRLITDAIFDGLHYRPRTDLARLREHAAGLVCLTGGLAGPLGRCTRGDRALARDNLLQLREIFGSTHLFVELQDTGFPGQTEQNALARSLAAELGLETVVTNDVRYLRPEDAVTLDLLNAVARGELVDDPARQSLPSDQQYLKSEAEMRALFPEDGDAIDRTEAVARRCFFKFKTAPPYFFPATDPPDPDPSADTPADTDANWAYFYRAFPPPRDFGLPTPEEAIPPRPPGAGSMNGYFEWYARQGLVLRLRDIPEALHAEYRQRLDFEIKVIEGMRFPAYLLIVAEFINWAKDHGIPVGPGRGSGAGSLVNYALRITDIDPIRFGLLFERFLNPDRVSMPDIDVDFCQDRREEVIAHTRKKYGERLVSQIITYGKLQAKAALKDVARAVGLEFSASDRIAKLVPNELGIKLEKAVLADSFPARIDGDPLTARIVTLAKRVEGMTRQTGVHAAGVVIADRPLVEHVPLYRDGADGGPVVQFEMKAAESVGLIKFDFLGLKTLDQIRDAVAMVARNTGETIDLARIPFEDAATFELLQRGDGLGVFQVESSGMRELLTRLRPTCIDDLIALLALYRPGPLSSGMVDNFIDCKHGRKPIAYPDDCLEGILKETYGSIVYQEQVMQIAQVYSGYTLGGADLLRRAMGKKKPEEMAKQKATFVDGAKAMGRDEKKADELFETLAFFAGYGFNKSHSAAYGVVAFHTAWLKAHHRAEYMAALMSVDAGNTDKVLMYIGDCRRKGLEILPPDINESMKPFDVPVGRRRVIRYGLAAVKGVGEAAVDAILEARAAAPGGRFADFGDVLEKIDHRRVNKKVLESLIKCGAFDSFGHARQAMFEGLGDAISAAQRAQEDRHAGQTSLFGRGAGAARVQVRLPATGEWPLAVKLNKEREALGFFLTGHPVAAYRGLVRRAATCSIADLIHCKNEQEVVLAGMVSTLKPIRTKKGDPMAFCTLEDESASVECVFFRDPWARSQAVLEGGTPVLVHGRLEKTAGEDGGLKILADQAHSLATRREEDTRAVHLYAEPEDIEGPRLTELSKLLQKSQGKSRLILHVRVGGEAWASLESKSMTVLAEESLMQSLEAFFRRPDAVALR